MNKCLECDKPARKRGLCLTHYSAWWNQSRTEPCIIDGCENIGRAKGLCYKHTARKVRNGSPHTLKGLGKYKGKSCTQCDQPATSNDMCSYHYDKWYVTSDISICEIEKCNKQVCRPFKYCKAHQARLYRYGDPTYIKKSEAVGPAHYEWKEKPGYGAAHRRIYKQRGKASDYACVDCGQQAQDWSLNLQSDYELVEWGGKPTPVSYNIYDYDPRCKRCHSIYDGRNQNLSWWNEYADA